jgi:hypothetical protein
MTPTAIEDRVLLVVWMPLWAVRLSRMHSGEIRAAEHVISRRHNLEMGWVDATPVAAQMVNL